MILLGFATVSAVQLPSQPPPAQAIAVAVSSKGNPFLATVPEGDLQSASAQPQPRNDACPPRAPVQAPHSTLSPHHRPSIPSRP